MGGHQSQELFVDGITESLTTDLSRIQGTSNRDAIELSPTKAASASSKRRWHVAPFASRYRAPIARRSTYSYGIVELLWPLECAVSPLGIILVVVLILLLFGGLGGGGSPLLGIRLWIWPRRSRRGWYHPDCSHCPVAHGPPVVLLPLMLCLIRDFYAARAVSCGISCVITSNFVSLWGPKEVIMGTSAASRPRAIRIRPIRRLLWRGSNAYQRPPM